MPEGLPIRSQINREAQGGIVLAQDPQQSRVRGMPDAIVEGNTASVVAVPVSLASQRLDHVRRKR
ncbi:chemotaxis protein CheB [Mucilaginibacter myungsuensis]|uniref:CheB-type methylesterase domain-containing protein n=1 Tax=Mucilaginibacter myungsuensis TaxID=649104 RepID=A0A929PXI8_9SPHI|nr:hypothetical protein [Mucilaginibacter myungsuensis]